MSLKSYLKEIRNGYVSSLVECATKHGVDHNYSIILREEGFVEKTNDGFYLWNPFIKKPKEELRMYLQERVNVYAQNWRENRKKRCFLNR